MAIKAVNWNSPDDDYSLTFWNQNVMQFWTDEEIPVSDDKTVWDNMEDHEKDTYIKVLGGLTLLDTIQGGVGAPKIMEHVDGLQRKAVLGFMSMMEQIHAKSYSSIYTTLTTKKNIDDVFAWVEKDARLQYKANRIVEYYNNINDSVTLYLAMVASVMLESCLFYSGFFYPLYLSGGRKKLTSSVEIIQLIIRDESIHGVYIGALAQELYENFTDEERAYVDAEREKLFADLIDNEFKYTEEVYANEPDLIDQVKEYIKYNVNKSLMNLGFEPMYEDVEVNPIVLNGISNTTIQHDFFSKKGNGYVRTLNIEPIEDGDLDFD